MDSLVLFFLFVTLTIVITYLILRRSHVNKLHNELVRPVVEVKDKSKLSPELIPFAGLSIYDAYYSISRLDYRVLETMDRISKKDLSSFHSQLLEAEIKYSGWFDFGKSGERLKNLNAYVAEKIVAQRLEEEGHTVVIADKINQPGWDLLVDGQPINVKNSLNPEYINKHFEKYPDIPVDAPTELGDHFSDNPNVDTEHFSHQEVEELTSETIENITSIGYYEGVPLIALGLSSLKEGSLLVSGKTDLRTASGHVATDTLARIGGVWAGAKVGALGGSFLGPIGTGVGAVIGGLIGIATGRDVARHFKERHLRDAQEKVKTAIIETARRFPQAIKIKRQALIEKRKKVLASVKKSNLFKRLFWPSMDDLVYYDLSDRYNAPIIEMRKLSEKVRGLLQRDESKVDESKVLEAGGLAVKYGSTEIYYPYLSEAIDKVVTACKDLEREMAKLGMK